MTAKIAGMNTSITPAPLRNPTRSEIPGLLAELDESGLGVAAFARSRGLKPHQLYVARRRLKAGGTPAPVFDPVRILGAAQSSGSFELRLRGGHQLIVPADFDASALRDLLEVLGSC